MSTCVLQPLTDATVVEKRIGFRQNRSNFKDVVLDRPTSGTDAQSNFSEGFLFFIISLLHSSYFKPKTRTIGGKIEKLQNFKNFRKSVFLLTLLYLIEFQSQCAETRIFIISRVPAFRKV